MFCAESTSHHCTAPNKLPAFNSVQIGQAQWFMAIAASLDLVNLLIPRSVTTALFTDRSVNPIRIFTYFFSVLDFVRIHFSSVRNANHKSVHTEMETRVMERAWDWIMRLYCRIAEAVYTPLWWLRGAMIGAGEGLPFSQRLRRRWPSLQAKSRHPASDHRSL